MANIGLTTIGAKVSYAIETKAGTRPTSDYIHIAGLKSTPDLNIAPSTGDGTTFENEEFTTKIPLLKEMPDTLEFNAVLGQDFYDTWETLVSSTKTALESGLQVWFCIDIKGLSKSIYFTGEPVKMGIPAMEVNSVIECPVYIVPTGEPVFTTDPTYKSGT